MLNIGLIVYPGFQVLGLAMCATFELANNSADEPVYSLSLLSEQGGMVQTFAGFVWKPARSISARSIRC